MSGKVLVAGATGTIGRVAAEAFVEAGWSVVTVSRRTPDLDGTTHLALDLRDASACQAALSSIKDVTHVVYAALYEMPGLVAGWLEADQMTTNLDMLRNLMAHLKGSPVEHVSLLQGAKAYGGHVHPIPVPAKVEAPRDPHDNFYWLQEDYLRALSAERGFAMTILRPQLLVGGTVGSAMNIPPVIGVYAAICREQGRPFSFPGGAPFVWEAVDARACASALVWAATSPAAVDRTFNITNGDVFTWRDLWPGIAHAVGLEPAPDEPLALATFLPQQSAVWDRIVAKHELRPMSLPDLLGESHHYTDFCFNHGNEEPWPPIFLSTITLRQAGFGDCFDTSESFRYWLSHLALQRIIPTPR